MQRGNKKEQTIIETAVKNSSNHSQQRLAEVNSLTLVKKKKLFVIRVYGGFKGKIIEMKSLVVLLTAILLNLILEMIMTFSNVVSF